MPGFYEGSSKAIDAVVPLAMRKWELDTQNARLQESINETKRQHAMSTGMELLKIGAIPQAAQLLKAGGMDVDPAVLSEVPGIKAINMGLQGKIRELDAEKLKAQREEESINFLRDRLKPQWGMPVMPGTPTAEAAGMPAGKITFDDVLKAIAMRGDAKELGGVLSKEATADNKDKMADLKLLIAQMGQGGLDKRLATMLQIALMNEAGRNARNETNEGGRQTRFETTPRPMKMNESDALKYKSLLAQRSKIATEALMEPEDRQKAIGPIEAEIANLEAKYTGGGTPAAPRGGGPSIMSEASARSALKAKGITGSAQDGYIQKYKAAGKVK